MHRIDTSRAILTRPQDDEDPATAPGFFSGGIPGLTLATQFNAAWCNALQENVMQAVAGGGVTPTKGPAGDMDLREAIRNTSRAYFKVDGAAAGFIPAANWAYERIVGFTPQFPSVVIALSWVNSAEEQPIQATPVTWSIENKALINGVAVGVVNSALSSMVIGMTIVPAGTPTVVASRITTAQPPAIYKFLTHSIFAAFFPWGEIF